MDRFKDQVKTVKPRLVSVMSREDAVRMREWVASENMDCEVVFGDEGLVRVATEGDLDLVVMAVVGAVGIRPTYEAVKRGISVAIACKEVLVSAGHLVMAGARQFGAEIIPIDSEHAALKQCLAGVHEDQAQVSRLVLTASGGPFFKMPLDQFSQITKAQALHHPNWEMGAKITIDSATMMNKGLEVIEAHHLFSMPFSQIDVVIHPKSIVHSLVEFTDGTFIAQMGTADMRFPIQYAMSYPEKWPNVWPKLSLTEMGDLTFFPPDFDRFPLLKLAYQAGEKGGAYPVILNASNESAVQLFLEDRISFLDISKVVFTALDRFSFSAPQSIEEVLSIDAEVRRHLLS